MGRLKDFEWFEFVFDTLGNEHAGAIFELLKPRHAEETEAVCFGIAEILLSYRESAELSRRIGDRRSHSKRIEQIASTAKKLSSLFGNEPFLAQLVSGARGGAAGLTGLEIQNLLDAIAKNAGSLADDPASLDKLRQRAEPGRSPERMFIWENVFRIFQHRYGKVGVSADGPIFKAIAAVHEGLSLPPPSGDSVKAAIKDFKERQRGYPTDLF